MYAWQFAKAQAIAERRGWAKFVSMQDFYNLLYREEEREMIPLCKDQGMVQKEKKNTVYVRAGDRESYMKEINK